jgi:hypothetical protein
MNGFNDLCAAVCQLDAEARQMVASAAAQGDFDEVARLTPVAKEIAALAGALRGYSSPSGHLFL